MSDGERIEDFDDDGHLDDCEAWALAGQTDEVRMCGCAGLLLALVTRNPYEPPGLRDLIQSLTYKRGWRFYLALFREEGDAVARGWRFHVISDTENSLHPDQRIRVNHAFPVPPASWNRDTWAAWLFDRVRDVETHEAGEFFRLDGYREFAPHHSNGEDPYRVWHVGDHETARKSAGED